MYSIKYIFTSLFLCAGLLACPMSQLGSGAGVSSGGSGGEKEPGPVPGPGVGELTQTEKNPGNWGLDGAGTPVHSGVEVEGVGLNDEGSLELRRSTRVVNDYMWLADTGNGRVSKFEMRTGKELARYPSVIRTQHEFPESNYFPSRTAIDLEGNAWIANRGGARWEAQLQRSVPRPSVLTKIAAEKEDCRNNAANTSQREENANGTVNITVVENDDCVLFSRPVCTVGSESYGENQGARALAVDSKGHIWVGCFHERAAYKFDAKTGEQLAGPIKLGIQPYGAIGDGRGAVWFSSYPAASVQGVHADTHALIGPPAIYSQSEYATLGACSAYGLAVDRDNRIWLAGVSQNSAAVACAYDHYAVGGPRWRRCELSPGNFRAARGIASNKDGNMYMSSNLDGRLMRFKWNDADGPNGSCEVVPIAGQDSIPLGLVGGTLIGVGMDASGNPWSVAQHAASAGGANGGSRAARVHLAHDESKPVGPDNPPLLLYAERTANYNPSYYTYSDFTGYQLRNFTAPEGYYRRIIEGCSSYSSWKSVAWEATVPQGTSLHVFIKVANTREELPSAQRYGPFTHSPVDLRSEAVPQSTLMQLEFVLETSSENSPALRSYEVKWVCEPPFS